VTAARALALVVALAAMLAWAPPASGHGVLTRKGDVLRYEVTNVGVGATLRVSTPETGILEFEDTTSTGGISWGPCTPVTERRARCRSNGVSRIEIESDENDDSLSNKTITPAGVIGGPGDDRIVGGYGDDALEGDDGADKIVGGQGADSVSGSDGDDVIEIRDGFADTVSCGLGFDQVTADADDQPALIGALDCESFDVGAPPPRRRPPNPPPDTRITKSPDRRTESDKAVFKFKATEARATFECRRDSNRFRRCKSPKRYRRLDHGRHVFEVRARDAAGNTDPTTASFHWKVLK
jgi:hypothetical protein